MRQVLYNSQHTFISVKDEFDALKIYLELELLRFNNSFYYSISIDSEIDVEAYKIPPLLIQPFIENAILHGILESNKKGALRIELNLQGNKIICVIEDNGIGINKSKSNTQKSTLIRHKSLGSKITTERLKLINSLYKINSHYKLIDLSEVSEQTGTRVELSLPVIK